jgi:putative DNA primase/helicase
MTENEFPEDSAEAIAALIEGDVEPADPEAFAYVPPPAWMGFIRGRFHREDAALANNERPGDTGMIDREMIIACSREPQNDTGNGARLLKHFGADFLHVRNAGWHAWAGTNWEAEGGSEIVTRFAQTTAARIVLETDVMGATPNEQREIDAASAAREKIVAIDKVESTAQSRRRRQRFALIVEAGDAAAAAVKVRQIARRKFSVSSGNAGRIKGMIDQALPHRTVTVDQLDAEKLALNVRNGTLRFLCEETPDPDASDHSQMTIKRYRAVLFPHNRADLITKVAPVDYDPDATCPTFEASLERFQPIAAVRGFLQRYHGYGLTGTTGEQCLVFYYGNGSNWKSTFVEIVAGVMGPYAQTIPFESLTGDAQRNGSQASPEFARLPGARLVRASEVDRGQQFREGLIKALTGGEPILTRANFKDFFEFRPDFKLVLSGNHKPEISGVDHGIWRRMNLVPWPVKIGKHEKRPMPEVLAQLQPERSGILNWLVKGTLDYLNGGLQIPPEVVEATAAYQEEMDPVGAFIGMCVESQLPHIDRPVDVVPARMMYDAFTAWAYANSVRPWKEKSFATAMSEKGFIRKKHRDGMRYQNVKLQNVPDAPRRPHRGDGEPPHPAESDIVPV